MTLTANDGNVNATALGLGINDSSLGDDTNGPDTINLIESLTFSFDVDVIFNTISVTDVGVNDALSLFFDGVAATPITVSGDSTYNEVLLAGETLVITATEPNSPLANNGVTITQFTVTAIPEPSTSALIGLAAMALIFRKRR